MIQYPLNIPDHVNGREIDAWVEANVYVPERRRQARRTLLRARARALYALAESMSPPTIGTIAGLAVPFEVWGRPDPLTRELIGPNAVTSLLAGDRDVRFLVDHDSSLVLANRAAFSLRLSKAPNGLRIEADLPQTDAGERVARIVEQGGATGFSFDVLRTSDVRTDTMTGIVQYVVRLDLSEISLMTSPNVPAYPLVQPISWKHK